MKWPGLRPSRRDVGSVQRSEEEWPGADQLSLFLVVQHHHIAEVADWRNSLGVATYNSLTKVGFADGWTLPLRAGPRRHPLLDASTISEFITLNRHLNSR